MSDTLRKLKQFLIRSTDYDVELDDDMLIIEADCDVSEELRNLAEYKLCDDSDILPSQIQISKLEHNIFKLKIADE